jgi:hypothetical protein
MTWPTNDSNIITTNLDSGTDSPANARVNLKDALDEIKNIINGRNQASGVAGLDASSKITNTQLPNTIISSTATNLTLTPATNVVVINNVIKLTPISAVSAYAVTGLSEGMIAMIDNADSTESRPAYYSGSGSWKYFSDNTIVPNA